MARRRARVFRCGSVQWPQHRMPQIPSCHRQTPTDLDQLACHCDWRDDVIKIRVGPAVMRAVVAAIMASDFASLPLGRAGET